MPPSGRHRAADSRTRSIKLGRTLTERLFAMAGRHGVTPHAIMKEGVRRYLDVLEATDRVAERAAPDHETVVPGAGLTAEMARNIANGVCPMRAVRGGRGFTFERLAARLGELGVRIDAQELDRIEGGEVSATPELLAALARALGVSAAVLVG